MTALREAGAESPDTDLFEALGRSDVRGVLRRALAAGANPSGIDSNGSNTLSEAVRVGSMECLRTLLDLGAKPDGLTGDGATPLMEAAAYGRLEILKLLLDRGANTGLADMSGLTAVMHATSYNAREVMRIIIGRGADVRARDTNGNTVLMHVAEYGSVDLLKVVLDRGAAADINSANTYGETALMRAAETGVVTKVRMLLEKGADPNRFETSGGYTALGYAAWLDRYSKTVESDFAGTVRLLITYGAKPNTPDKQGDTPLDLALSMNKYDVADVLRHAGGVQRKRKPSTQLSRAIIDEDVGAVQKLLKQGINPNVVDESGYTPLIEACIRSGRASGAAMVNLLLEHGAKPDLRGTTERTLAPTALYEAAEEGNTAIIRLLIKRGADPNAWFIDETPLMAACAKAQYESCKTLIECGANVNAQHKDGGTALGEAARFGGALEIAEVAIGTSASLGASDPDDERVVKLPPPPKGRR